MKLYLNKASPYARLVLVVGHEKGLSERIELVWTDPWASPEELLSVNPFSKVPALVLDDVNGHAIIESACICQYLDDIGAGRRLLPVAGEARMLTLRKHGHARALIDASFGAVIQRRFSSGEAKSELAERWLAATRRGIATQERNTQVLQTGNQPDIGDLALAVGLSYVDFRLPELKWRSTSPGLSAWLDRINERPSLRQTAPA